MTHVNSLMKISKFKLELFVKSMAILIFTLSLGCNKKSDNTDDSTSSVSAIDLIAASSNVVADGISSMESNPSAFSTKSVSLLSTCNSLTAPTCSSNTKTIDFGGCTKTNNNGLDVTVYGSSLLTFTGTNCSMSASTDSVTRTFSNHYITVGSLGGKILVYTNAETIGDIILGSSDLLNYDGQSRSGGSTLTNTDGGNNYTLSISGVHRKRIKANGNTGFWHTLYTSDPMTISKSGTVKTLNGSVSVAHNILKITATTSFENTTYDSSANCCYPTGGSITYQVGSNPSSVYTFSSTCGDVSIDGGAATSLPACGGSSE